MRPLIDVLDESFGSPQRFRETFFEIVETELCDERLWRDAIQPRSARDKRPERRNRSSHEFIRGFSIAGGLDVSLAKMHDVTARLNLARAAKFRFWHGYAFKEICSENHVPRRNDFAELQWEGITRARKLRFKEKERRVETELCPFPVQSGTAIEVAECEALDYGAGVGVAAERRHHSQPITENPL